MRSDWVLVAEKELQNSDLNSNLNRLLLRRDDARDRLLPLLRPPEVAKVMNGNGINLEIFSWDNDLTFEVRFKFWSTNNGYIFNGDGWVRLREYVKEKYNVGSILRLYARDVDVDVGDDDGGNPRRLQLGMVVGRDRKVVEMADALVSFRREMQNLLQEEERGRSPDN